MISLATASSGPGDIGENARMFCRDSPSGRDELSLGHHHVDRQREFGEGRSEFFRCGGEDFRPCWNGTRWILTLALRMDERLPPCRA
jgi:hypothetical protein